ncbi:MAG: hypothetical protein HYW48_06670 [Deltaproteobacteria bacterium]|nr:hypothetical protein [Deltaproteobacteria bacterium]
MHSSLVNRSLYGIAWLLMAIQFVNIVTFSVNVPAGDEWEPLRSTIFQSPLSLDWLFALHNEHRIPLTKLITWMMFKFFDWNVSLQIALNYVLYVLLASTSVLSLQRFTGAPCGIILCLFASTIPHENHFWGFQSQFHLFLLFFVLSTVFLLRTDKWRWLSPAFAVLSAYSFSSGVICSWAVGGASVLMALQSRRNVREFLFFTLTALSIFAASLLWFKGFQKNPGHPAFVWPWMWPFWEHFFNTLALGFGYTEQNVLPGAIIFLMAIPLTLHRFLSILRRPELQRQWVASLVLLLGITACLGAISLARASLGLKSSRYGEIGFIFMLPFWVLLWGFVKEIKFGSIQKTVVALGLGLVLALPFLDDFNSYRIYKQIGLHRQAGLSCMQSYYAGGGDGFCPTLYPASLKEAFDQAKALHLSFVPKDLGEG